MKKTKKLFAFAVVVALLVSLCVISTSAANTDYLYPCDGVYVLRLEPGDISYVGFYDPNSPLTEAQAEDIEIDIIGDDFDIYLDEPYVDTCASGYAKYVYFYVDDFATYGAVSIEATYNGKSGNITVSVDAASNTPVEDITVVFKNGANELGRYVLDELGDEFYGNTQYTSAFDTLIACIGDTPYSGYAINNYTYDLDYAALYYYVVNSMTINNVLIANYNLQDGSGSYAWHLKVERGNDVVEGFDADDFCLRDGDTVIWEFKFTTDVISPVPSPSPAP